MEQMAAAKFEHEGLILADALATAVNERLAEPIDEAMLKETPTAVIAAGLEQLGFVAKGL